MNEKKEAELKNSFWYSPFENEYYERISLPAIEILLYKFHDFCFVIP